jgi:hypothetical protein
MSVRYAYPEEYFVVGVLPNLQEHSTGTFSRTRTQPAKATTLKSFARVRYIYMYFAEKSKKTKKKQ